MNAKELLDEVDELVNGPENIKGSIVKKSFNLLTKIPETLNEEEKSRFIALGMKAKENFEFWRAKQILKESLGGEK